MTNRKHATAEPEDHAAVVSIRLTRHQHAELKRLAADQHRTVSQQVRHLVDVAIGDHGAERPAA